jgi:alpha-tubulin suppressor-like RCC1 family protein
VRAVFAGLCRYQCKFFIAAMLLALPVMATAQTFVPLAGVQQVAAGAIHTCAVVAGGEGRCWGSNNSGRLGDNSMINRPTPVAVSGLMGATAIAAGGAHTCAVVAGGAVRCWGFNGEGQLGDSGTTNRLTPVAVSGLTGATAIAAGLNHACAVVAGGEVRCWGFNGAGQLGDNSTTQRLTPVAVSGLTGATAIAAGVSHTCAVVAGGEVRCWGNNGDGQLGDNSTTNRLTPVAVSGLTGATAIAAGDSHTCAVVAGGEGRCWGRNVVGQLGDSSTTSRRTPVAVSGLTGASALAAGRNHTCAVVAGGEGRCWGFNNNGQLGDNSTTNRPTPVAVSGLTGATTLTAGEAHTCASVAGGEGRCWGQNGLGQLGDNSSTQRLTPVAVLTMLSSQAITFGVAPFVVVGGTGAVSATGGGSGNPVVFSSNTLATCTVSGSTVSGVSAGTCTIAANQAGGGNFAAAAQVLQSFAVTKASQTITFANPGSQSFGTSPTLGATASSGLAVSFGSVTAGVCTVTSGGVLTFVTTGTCTINANQAGNATFDPAPQVQQSFAVNAVVPGAPTIGTATAGDAQASVAFTAPASNGGSAITGYTVTSNPGGLTGTGASSPITVSGLTNGTAYTFTVTATNSVGTGSASAASNSVTPSVAVVAPVLRPDRVVVRENSGEARIDVLANDSIAPALLGAGVLSIIDAPARGAVSVLALGATGLSGDVIAYTPSANVSGTDTLRYRTCFGGATPCVDSTLSIEIRPVDAAGIEFSADSDRGRRDVTLSGLRTLPGARFDAHGLVAPVVVSPSLTADSTPETPFDAGGAETTLRTFAASTSARSWRVFVDARSLSGGDVDVYLGLDANNNGQADSSEAACVSAMSSVAERCELAVSQVANASARYWVRLHSRSGAQNARAEIFEVPLDVPAADRAVAATGPGSLAASTSFPIRLVWNDATLVPGELRGGWVEVKSEANTSLGWVPVRIQRTAGVAVPFALQSGVDHALALAGSAANDGLYIDVPTGMTRLDVTTTSASNVDLYLARVDAPAPNSATPTVPSAPARNLASASATTPSGNESLTVNNPAAGRWYVTTVNAAGGTAAVTVRATLTGTGPQLRPGGFFNPERSGNGLFLYPAGNQWAGLWYTYLQDGTPTWYYLQAPAPGAIGIWRGTIYRSAWNGSSNFLTPVGEATVTPRSTSAFTFSYTLDGETGSEAYENFGGGCPTFAGAPLNASGHWFDPARAGSGYSVQLFPNYEFYTVFGYDAQGVPRYLIAERSGIGAATETLTLAQNTGACPLCTRTGNPVRTTVGTLTRTVGSGTLQRIQLTGAYTAGVPGTWAANDAVTPLGSLQGCAAN